MFFECLDCLTLQFGVRKPSRQEDTCQSRRPITFLIMGFPSDLAYTASSPVMDFNDGITPDVHGDERVEISPTSCRGGPNLSWWLRTRVSDCSVCAGIVSSVFLPNSQSHC